MTAAPPFSQAGLLFNKHELPGFRMKKGMPSGPIPFGSGPFGMSDCRICSLDDSASPKVRKRTP